MSDKWQPGDVVRSLQTIQNPDRPWVVLPAGTHFHLYRRYWNGTWDIQAGGQLSCAADYQLERCAGPVQYLAVA